ncbi:excalibur calcium-binding domain-containing protein [Pseudonocardia xishanensis]|uniref:PASTA domain-containing protein n=1 Tax=Pseudonocardia xishanensis TaxID=630995 RepID=A0ABP8RN93_9PSEU
MTATQQWSSTVQSAPKGNRPATAGFVLGLVGLLAGLVPFLGLVVTVPAVLASRAGRARFRAGAAATPGRSGAGLVLGAIGTGLCVLMSVVAVVGAANAAPKPVVAVASVAAPVPAAPVLLTVPNVVGMSDVQARETLRLAGFTTVQLGPSTGSVAGVAAGTVTSQLPGTGAQASAGDPITLGEAAEPPVVAPAPAPVVTPQPVARQPVAPQPVAQQPVASRRSVPAAAPQPVAAAPRVVAPDPAPASAYYADCSAARAAGAAPLHRGDAGYRSALDRDNDGVACE